VREKNGGNLRIRNLAGKEGLVAPELLTVHFQQLVARRWIVNLCVDMHA
jgi:hypothetical protein